MIWRYNGEVMGDDWKVGDGVQRVLRFIMFMYFKE